MDFMAQLLQDILSVCDPEKIILFAEKRTLSTQKLKSISICVIADGWSPNALRTKLYLALQADLPVSIHVYAPAQWRELLEDDTSYASFIARKGQVIYESEA